MGIGEKIKEYRVKKGMTQGELAKAIGSTTAAISRYELGQREARYSQLQAMAAVLDAPEAEFLDEYPREPLKINDYKKRLSDIEDMLDKAVKEERPARQIEAVRQIHSVFTQLLCEERFSLKISGETQCRENQLIETRKNSVQGELLAAMEKLNAEAQKTAVSRVKELSRIPSNRRVLLPDALLKYIYDKHKAVYELETDTEKEEPLETDDGQELHTSVRHVSMVQKTLDDARHWNFIYYQFSGRPDDSAVKEIVSQHESYDNKQDRYSFVLDNEERYNQFISCHEDIRNQSDLEPNNYLVSGKPEITFFLINKDTWEIREIYSSSQYTPGPDDMQGSKGRG